jgi:hypothetical protein
MGLSIKFYKNVTLLNKKKYYVCKILIYIKFKITSYQK